MSVRIRRNFTLIELLAVMLLMGMLMLVMLPAFNRMIRGNKVDQMTANLKLGLEQAQAEAVSSRRSVALVLPTAENVWNASNADERAIIPFCYGGYRLAYVQTDGTKWTFIRWVPGSEWKNAPDGAMLVEVLESGTDYSATEGTGLSNVLSTLSTAALSGSTNKLNDPLITLENVNLSSSTTIAQWSNCALIFSPYGGLVSSNLSDLRFVVAEAIPSGTTVVYPSRDSTGPTNWLMLSVNKFTGRVEYYPPAN